MNRAAALAAALVIAATGCSRGAAPRKPTTTETRFLDALSTAIGQINNSRQRLADDGAALDEAARLLDAIDAVALRGDRATVRTERKNAAKKISLAKTLARRVARDVADYDKAVTALGKATGEGLTNAQRAAVEDVVDAGRAEVSELRRYAASVATDWPRYEELDEHESLWLARASNGWYRDQKESAGAYAVLSDRQRLAKARSGYAAADARRVGAARAATRSIAAARAALASLLA